MTDQDKPGSDLDLSDLDVSEKMRRFIESDGKLPRIRGFSDTEIDGLYSAAHAFYDHEKYEKALVLFRCLCFNDHPRKRNWMGAGAACQMQQKYHEAIEAYGMAVLLDYSDPRPHLHAGECFIAVHDRDSARDALRAAVELAGNSRRYSRLKKRAGMLLAKTARAVFEMN